MIYHPNQDTFESKSVLLIMFLRITGISRENYEQTRLHIHLIYKFLFTYSISLCVYLSRSFWLCHIASLVAQTVKPLSAMSAMLNPAIRVQSLGWEDPMEKEMATHSSILAWRIPWTEGPGELQSMGSQRVGHN